MREHPIPFTAPMVRALLNKDRPKTQTRRLVKIQPPDETEYVDRLCQGDNLTYYAWTGAGNRPPGWSTVCPYGQPGDRLWVRETWAIRDCGRSVSLTPEAWPDGFPLDRLQYTATDGAPWHDEKGKGYWWNLRPSTHMPRWASRIPLENTATRVERLLDITEGDARAEGVSLDWYSPEHDLHGTYDSYREAFLDFWDSLYAAKGLGTEANPWVWVVEFKRVEASA